MTDPGAAKRPIGLREGLRRLSKGLIAYGTIGVVVTVIGLLAFVWSLGAFAGWPHSTSTSAGRKNLASTTT